jgi:hypothetical protein
MRITTSGAIETVSGAHGNFVYILQKNGRMKARNRPDAEERRSKASPQQELVQSYITEAAKNWQTLSDLQRDAWDMYANAYFTKDEFGRTVTATGLSAYTKANSIRMLLGLPMTTNAPTQAPPSPVMAVSQLSGQNPDTLGISVTHNYASPAGHLLMVSMTPAGLTASDKPNDADYRLVRGASALSALALPASGGSLTFNPTRFLVQDGQRYGVEVRVVRVSDGLCSRARRGDFRKEV